MTSERGNEALSQAGSARSSGVPSLPALDALYRGVRYLDAYAITRDLWRDRTLPERLDLPALVFASRLAERLGSELYGRALARLAVAKAPHDPLVRYYCRNRTTRGPSLYVDLREFEDHPELDGADDELTAAWLVQHAVEYAAVRDFERARGLIDRACRLDGDDRYVLAGCAEVALAEDRRDEALAFAERAWTSGPPSPVVASAMADVLATVHSPAAAAERLLGFLDDIGSQSYHVHCIAIRMLLADAARSTDAERTRKARQAARRVAVARDLATLADRSCLHLFAWLEAEAARLAGDREALQRSAQRVPSRFYATVARNLHDNPNGRRLLLAHPFVRQLQDTCLPASVATCLGSLGIHVDQAELAAELTYDGTPMWRVVEYAVERGWCVRHFIVDAPSAQALVEAGIPFVITFRGHDWAHACAAVGIDFATRTLLVHDPQRASLRESLLDPLLSSEGPLGPRGLVLAPPARRAELQALALREEAAETARVAFDHELHELGEKRALERLDERLREVGSSEVAEYLRALALDLRGQHDAAIERFSALLERHPDSDELLGALSFAAYNTADTPRIRSLLGHIASRGRVPGVGSDLEWRHPPAVFRARYADFLRRSNQHRPLAQRLLLEALRDAPGSAECYHVLGDLLWDQGDRQAALLPFRLASALASAQEHYATTYADALWKLRRADEGIAWLRARTEHGGAAAPPGPWISLVETLESFGRPVEALDALAEGCRKRPEDGTLAAYAATVFAKYGRPEQVAAALGTSSEHAPPGESFRARTTVARIEGRTAEALELARAWVDELPTSSEARETLLQLVAQQEGPDHALGLARRWVEEHPDNQKYEHLLFERLQGLQAEGELESRLRARLQRDPFDAWAWRELGVLLLRRARATSGPRHREHLAALSTVVDRCNETQATHPASRLLTAELHHLQGDTHRAVELLRACIVEYPSYTYALRRLLDLIAERSIEERRREVAFLCDLAGGANVHDLSFASEVIDWVARSVGFAAAIDVLEAWSADSPDRASIDEAWADLHLAHVGGRAAATQVIERLVATVERYPLHLPLRQSLTNAHHLAGEVERALEVGAAIVRDFPGSAVARRGYGRQLLEAGRDHEAVGQLQRAVELAPHDSAGWHRLAGAHEQHGRFEAAIEVLERALAIAPDECGLLDHLVAMLIAQGRWDEALDRLRRAAQSASATSDHWALLGRTLDGVSSASPAEIDAAYTRAIELAPRSWDAVLEFTESLCKRERYDDARNILRDHLAVTEHSTVVHGQLALVDRRSGATERAVRALRTLLQTQPDYRWGWQTLLGWAEQDESLGLAREVIAAMTEALPHDALLGMARLRVLAHFRVDEASLDRAWLELVAEHPNDTQVALGAFDHFLERGALDLAEQTITGHYQRRPLSAAARAGRVQLRCARRDPPNAIVEARGLWSTATDANRRDCALGVAALLDADSVGACMDAMLSDLRAGAYVAPPFVIEIIGACRKQQRIADLSALAHVYATRPSRRDGELLAHVFDALCLLGYAAQALDFVAANRDRCREDPELYMAAAQALACARAYPEVCDWLADWEQHPGVTMWGVTSLLVSGAQLEQWPLVRHTAARALDRLAPDHQLPTVAYYYVLSLVYCDDGPEFVAAYAIHGKHITAESCDEFTATVLGALHALLGTDASTDELVLLDRHISAVARREKLGDHALVRHWRKHAAKRIGGWRRLAHKLGAW